MEEQTNINVDASRMRIAIAVSRYHAEITGSMRDAAMDAFARAEGQIDNLHIVNTAGTFELTAVCRELALAESHTGRPIFDAIVALGCVITGETTHDRYIARSVTQGLTSVVLETGTPIGFGVLTCQTIEQARARSIDAARSGRGNKGAEAMIAAIDTARTLAAIRAMAKEVH